MHSSTAVSFVAGVLSHLAYFNKGEHHLYGMDYLHVFLAAIASSAICLQYQQDLPWSTALANTLHFAALYLSGVYTSLITYRLFFHPLRRFPGPIGARISSLWFCTQVSKHDAHRQLLALHKEYGPIVRIGSSDLSIIHPSGIGALYGQNTRCTKGSWYDMSYPAISMQTMRDPVEHRIRRRAWSPAFGDNQLRGYEVRLRPYRQRLLDRFTGMVDEPVDIRKWFNLYTFDVMGDLTFGEGFGGIERGQLLAPLELVGTMVYFIGLFMPVWVLCLLSRLPLASKGWFLFLDWAAELLNKRIKNPPSIPDISAALIAHLDGREPTKKDQLLLGGDSRLIMFAGSDTTSTALTAIVYELLQNPGELSKLRSELAPHVEADGDFVHLKIQHLEHLNGIINEALRLHPVVPDNMQRKTPPEGIRVDGVWIPGDMTVMCPQYVLGRSERCYVKPNSFIPERWYSSPQLVRDKSAFAPFSIGPASCIGKPLALMNVRATIARFVMEFDFEFAPGTDRRQFEDEAMDNFILVPGKLTVVLKRREKGV